MGYTTPIPDIDISSTMDIEDTPKPPEWPLDRITVEGAINTSGICPNCHSTAKRKPWLFGKRYCYNEKCFYNINAIPDL